MDFFDDSSASSPPPERDFAAGPLEDFGEFGASASGSSPAEGGDFFGSPAGSFDAATAPVSGSVGGSFDASATASFGDEGSFGSFDGATPSAAASSPAGSFDAAASFDGASPGNDDSFGDSFGDSFDASPADANGSFPEASPSSFDSSFDASSAPAADAFGGSFEAASEEAAPLSDDFGAAPAAIGSFDAPQAESPAPASSGSMSAMMGTVQVTSDLMRQYEVEHNKFLEEKIAEEKAKHAEVVATAKKDLENFYAERKQRSAKARAENIAASDGTTENAPASDKEAWKNLAGLVNINDGSKDQSITERMRGVILDMKHAA